MAAAAPPSAMTVCALPNSDLEMIAVFLPASRASIAARRPAPPAPITTTSYVWRSIVVIAQQPSVVEPEVGDPASADRHDVEVGHRHAGQRDEGEHVVTRVQLRDECPHPVPDRVLREVL